MRNWGAFKTRTGYRLALTGDIIFLVLMTFLAFSYARHRNLTGTAMETGFALIWAVILNHDLKSGCKKEPDVTQD